MASSKCEVWSVKCEVASEVRSVKFEVWSVKCGVSSVKCEVSSSKCPVAYQRERLGDLPLLEYVCVGLDVAQEVGRRHLASLDALDHELLRENAVHKHVQQRNEVLLDVTDGACETKAKRSKAKQRKVKKSILITKLSVSSWASECGRL